MRNRVRSKSNSKLSQLLVRALPWAVGTAFFLPGTFSQADNAGQPTPPDAPAENVPPTPPNQLRTRQTPPGGNAEVVPVRPPGAAHPDSSSSLDPSNGSAVGAGVRIHFGNPKPPLPTPTNDETGEEEEE